MNNIITKKGNFPGKTSVIIAGTHGNEICGIEAFKAILPNLIIEKGTVHFIYGNPRAIESNVRYTEANLNRMFKEDHKISAEEKSSYEYLRSREIIPYLNESTALLDIHASHTKESIPFIICEENGYDTAKYLNVGTVVSGFDTLEPGGTDGYMNANGKVGICLECGYLGDPNSVDIAKENILLFLQAQGHIDKLSTEIIQKKYEMSYIYHTKTSNFNLVKDFEDFEFVEKGQLIGTDGQTEVLSPGNGIIMFARNLTTVNGEAFLWGTLKHSDTYS